MPAKPKKYKKPSKKAALTAQEKISRYMRGNKSKNTTPELKLRKALWQAGLRGYRIHWTKAPGKPDICYPPGGWPFLYMAASGIVALTAN